MSDLGECIITTTPEGQHIDRADPRILISAELVEQLRDRQWDPIAVLNGHLLRIGGTNRTVIYRIGEKTPDGLAYVAEWPD